MCFCGAFCCLLESGLEAKRKIHQYNENFVSNSRGSTLTKISMIIWRVALSFAVATFLFMYLGLKLDAHVWKHEIPANVWATFTQVLRYSLMIAAVSFIFANTIGYCLGSPIDITPDQALADG